eukprot:jgi/Ulvmu1/1781/UM118_0021.1
MYCLAHLLGAVMALAGAAADHDLNSFCEVGADSVFAEVGAASAATDRITDGCDGAAASTLCDAHGTGGPCRDEPLCTPGNTDIDPACSAATEDNGCCIKLYAKPCATCEEAVVACGQICSDEPLTPEVLAAPLPASTAEPASPTLDSGGDAEILGGPSPLAASRAASGRGGWSGAVAGGAVLVMLQRVVE